MPYMNRFFRRFIVALACLSTVGPLSAQLQDAQGYVNIQFSMLSWQRTLRDVHYVGANGEEMTLFVPNGAPSKVQEYYGPSPLVFYRKKGTDAEGNPIKEAIATYAPRTTAPQLLLFIPNKQREGTPYRILPLDFSADQLAPGAYRFYNLANTTMYVRFGQDEFAVPSGGSVTRPSDPSKARGLDVAMAMQISEEPNNARIVYSAGWTLRANRSAIVFITNNVGVRNEVDVKRVYFAK